MPFSHAYRPRPPLRETLFKGALIGTSGGLAEIAFIWTYMTVRGHEPGTIARAIAEAVHLGPSASAGIAVHMALSLLLGIGLMGAWRSVRAPRPRASAAYLFMTVALIVVWSFNFLVLLPSLNPALPALLPYPVSFAATLLFALAGAPLLQRAGAIEKPAWTVAHSRWMRP
ncbi:MAG TPA: hypothetical protein VG894_12950 [Bauldia sp.]|jgi:hypothetical protein|nr:hypothetical protein [Bauldia sp.]